MIKDLKGGEESNIITFNYER